MRLRRPASIVTALLPAVCLGLVPRPALAFECPSRIAHALALIGQAERSLHDAKVNRAEVEAKIKQARELVTEAERLHEKGQHREAVAKAQAAAALLEVRPPKIRLPD